MRGGLGGPSSLPGSAPAAHGPLLLSVSKPSLWRLPMRLAHPSPSDPSPAGPDRLPPPLLRAEAQPGGVHFPVCHRQVWPPVLPGKPQGEAVSIPPPSTSPTPTLSVLAQGTGHSDRHQRLGPTWPWLPKGSPGESQAVKLTGKDDLKNSGVMDLWKLQVSGD